MGGPAPRYVFDPLDRRGLVAGLRTGQLVLLGGGLVVGTGILREDPTVVGLLLAIVVAVGGAAGAFVSVGGQPMERWAPAVVRRAVRVAGRRTATRPATVRRPGEPVLPPAPPGLAGLSFAELEQPGGGPVGVLRDQASRSLGAVLSVRGRSFALLDGQDKARRLTSWSAVLAGLAREEGSVRSLQWVERTIPGDGAVLTRHLESACALAAGDPRVASYAELVAEAGPLGQDHECFVVLSVRTRQKDAEDVLLRELRLLQGQLRTADIEVVGTLSRRDLGAAIRVGFDPWSHSPMGRRDALHPDLHGVHPDTSWPISTQDGWSWWRTDDNYHATFWIAEWPRSEVGPDFISPLLLHSTAQRSLSVIMGPLPPSAGIREVEAARTAQAADEQLRQRAGFLPTARRAREAEGAARREAELSDGHAAYRFSGYVTVTARSPEALEDECGEIVQAGHQCRLDIRRLHGIQDLAFTWTLPLGRGLAGP